MHHLKLKNVLIVLGISGLIFNGWFGQTEAASAASVPNASFSNFIAATDSFPGWFFTKDATGGTKYIVTQETDSAHSTPGSLKMQFKDSTDTGFTLGVTTSITGLPPNKIFTITAWIKYANMPAYSNAMIYLQQATLMAPNWNWIDRKWGTLWGNGVGNSDWTQVTMSDTTKDSANVLNFGITLWKYGTLWIDDIAITYQDIPQAVKYSVEPARQGSIVNNQISFSREMPYSFEACSIDGRVVFHRSGLASALDLNRLDLKNGVYLVKVQALDKTYNAKVIVSK